MADIASALEKMLTENPGPISILAGIAALRAIGDQRDDVELQELIATFAAESWRPIYFDRFVGVSCTAAVRQAARKA